MTTTKATTWIALGIAASFLALGCAKKDQTPSAVEEPAAQQEAAPAETTDAVARLELGDDRVDGGIVSFSQEADGVKIVAHIIGAPPGTHGLHVHEVGDCSASDFKSAGGHFNPTDSIHGSPEDAERHAGDLGNIEIGADGSGHLELTSNMLTVATGGSAVVGRAVILHEQADDLVSQPTGAAGARLACGVVAAKEGI